MNRRNVLWLILIVLLAAGVVLTAWLAHRRSLLLSTLEKRPGDGAVAGELGGQMQSAKQDGYRELGKLREKLEESRTAVRRLTEEKGIQQKQLASAKALYYPPEEPTLEEWREAQPEEYEKLKKSLAHILRYAAAKKRLRAEYLARLDLSVLTEEEQQRLLDGMERIAREEERLLNGDGDAELYYKARGRRSFGDLERWLYEGTTADLAFAADWRQACGTAEPIASVFRAIALRHWHAPGCQPQGPLYIRGLNYMLIDDPNAPDGKRLVRIMVEPGWQPE